MLGGLPLGLIRAPRATGFSGGSRRFFRGGSLSDGVAGGPGMSGWALDGFARGGVDGCGATEAGGPELEREVCSFWLPPRPWPPMAAGGGMVGVFGSVGLGRFGGLPVMARGGRDRVGFGGGRELTPPARFGFGGGSDRFCSDAGTGGKLCRAESAFEALSWVLGVLVLGCWESGGSGLGGALLGGSLSGVGASDCGLASTAAIRTVVSVASGSAPSGLSVCRLGWVPDAGLALVSSSSLVIVTPATEIHRTAPCRARVKLSHRIRAKGPPWSPSEKFQSHHPF